MTIAQLKYVLEIAKTCSINKICLFHTQRCQTQFAIWKGN